MQVVGREIECFPPVVFYLHESTTGFAVPLFSLADPDCSSRGISTAAVNGTQAEELIGVEVEDPGFEAAATAELVAELPSPLPTPIIAVAVDIKPGSCPNPLNVKSKGVLPVAVLGTEEFDATQMDPASVRLEGVPPLRWAMGM